MIETIAVAYRLQIPQIFCTTPGIMTSPIDEPQMLMKLPPELRVMIYTQCFDPTSSSTPTPEIKQLKKQSSILRVARLVRKEALPIYKKNFQESIKLWAEKRKETDQQRNSPSASFESFMIIMDEVSRLLMGTIRLRREFSKFEDLRLRRQSK